MDWLQIILLHQNYEKATTILADADLIYIFRVNDTGSTMLFINAATFEGNLHISSYDVKQNVISGNYEVRGKGVADPTCFEINLEDITRCNLTVSGTFNKVKVVL